MLVVLNFEVVLVVGTEVVVESEDAVDLDVVAKSGAEVDPELVVIALVSDVVVVVVDSVVVVCGRVVVLDEVLVAVLGQPLYAVEEAPVSVVVLVKVSVES